MAKKSSCYFHKKGIVEPDYKEAVLLRRYLSAWNKIRPRKETGLCAAHQRALAKAIKRARILALLPSS